MKRYLCSLVALGLLVGVTGRAMAQPKYSFSTLDVPGTSPDIIELNGINASGQIVGSYNDHGLLLHQGSYTTLDAPGAVNGTVAHGINASGQIVGWYQDAAFNAHGFLLDNGNYTTLDVPGLVPFGSMGINDAGQIVGSYIDATGNHGFLATPVP